MLFNHLTGLIIADTKKIDQSIRGARSVLSQIQGHVTSASKYSEGRTLVVSSSRRVKPRMRVFVFSFNNQSCHKGEKVTRKCLQHVLWAVQNLSLGMCHSEDGDLSPSSGNTETPRDKPQRLISKHTIPFLVVFFFPSARTYFSKATTVPGNLKSSPASVTSSGKSPWRFFFSFPYPPSSKREREKTFPPHTTLPSQFQCRLLCWVLASNAMLKITRCKSPTKR